MWRHKAASTSNWPTTVRSLILQPATRSVYMTRRPSGSMTG